MLEVSLDRLTLPIYVHRTDLVITNYLARRFISCNAPESTFPSLLSLSLPLREQHLSVRSDQPTDLSQLDDD